MPQEGDGKPSVLPASEGAGVEEAQNMVTLSLVSLVAALETAGNFGPFTDSQVGPHFTAVS